MAKRSSISILPLLLLLQPSLQATSCYYPDGTFAEFDSPCFPDQAESICCGQGHTCMSNNLCRWPDSQMPYPIAYIRGSCTDSSWNSTECGDVCKTVFPSEWDPIVACPGAEFCCELDSNNPSSCCNLTNTTSHPLYTLAAASTVTVIGSSSTTSPSVSVSPTTITATALGGGGSQTSLAPTPTNPNNNNGNSSGGSNAGTKIGIGVGVGGGVLLLLAGIALVFYLRKKRGGVGEVHPELDRAGDIGIGKAELPAQAPGYSEHKNVPMESGYQKGGGDTSVYSGLGAGQRLSEMP